MSVWTTPATWVNGAVTAATANTEWRDHLNWLKNWADLITNSTAADTGTATYIYITRPAAADEALAAKVSGDANERIKIRAGGGIQMGDGTAAPQVVASFGGGVLTFDRFAQASGGFRGPTKAGVWNDTDIPGYFTGSASGMFGFDTTNHRFYWRSGSTWKFVQGQ